MRILIIICSVIALSAACYFGVALHQDSKEKNRLQYDYAEINRVNYGLFNLQLWKEKALDIFTKRISEFKISPKAYDGLDAQISVFIEQMFDEYLLSGKLVDEIADGFIANSKIPKLFVDSIKEQAKEAMKTMDLSKQVPAITKQISREVRKSEPQLRKIMQDELMSLVLVDEEENFVEKRTVIYEKYGFDNIEETRTSIISKIESIDGRNGQLIKYIIGCLLIAFLLVSLLFKIVDYSGVVLVYTGICVVLLVLGVTLPTIDLDARLNGFSISLVGEEISFDEQVLYFESKSILGVTKTLWEGAGVDLKVVAILIFLFSVAFPFLKLLLSVLYVFWDAAKDNKVVQNILFYLGKWSMADVFVIALFMAYIGFYGLVTSQLGGIANNQTGYAVETLNYTKLGPGVLFFTSYVILSVITSIIINKHHLKRYSA
jgi:hypothetical protein